MRAVWLCASPDKSAFQYSTLRAGLGCQRMSGLCEGECSGDQQRYKGVFARNMFVFQREN